MIRHVLALAQLIAVPAKWFSRRDDIHLRQASNVASPLKALRTRNRLNEGEPTMAEMESVQQIRAPPIHGKQDLASYH